MKQNKTINTSDWISAAVILMILFFSTALLYPKIVSRFPFRRHMLLNDLLKQTKATKSVNEQQFWQFREFYSPGTYDFNRTGLSGEIINKQIHLMTVGISKSDITLPFMIFVSPRLLSLDSLTHKKYIKELDTVKNINFKGKILLQTDTIMMKENEKETLLIFILPVERMKNANGFFDYREKDKAVLEDKNNYWLDISLIQK